MRVGDDRVDRDRVLRSGGVDAELDGAVGDGHLGGEVGSIGIERDRARGTRACSPSTALDDDRVGLHERGRAHRHVDGDGQVIGSRDGLVDGVAVLDAVGDRAIPLR